MSKSILAICSHDLARVTGGAITGARNVHQGARILDALAPDEVSLQIGPVGVGWNLPERPFTDALNYFGVPKAQPAKPATTKPDKIRGAVGSSIA